MIRKLLATDDSTATAILRRGLGFHKAEGSPVRSVTLNEGEIGHPYRGLTLASRSRVVDPDFEGG